MKTLRALIPVVLIALAGCRQPPTGCRCQGVDLERTFLQYATFHDKLVFIVWSDLGAPRNGTAAGDTGSAARPDKTVYDGSRSTSDGHQMSWKAVTTDGKAGTVTIADKDYPLADGRVFLVRAKEGPVQVTQVKHDLSDLTPGPATWDLLAKQNAEVKRFVNEAGEKK
jgi:hypothetical protein